MTPTATLAPPEQQPQLSEDQLLELLKDPVEKLLTEHVDDEANFEKLLQYLRIRKADYYYRGIQYVAPELSPTGVIDYSPLGAPTPGIDGGSGRGVLDYNIDKIKTYGRKFIATLGQRPFYNVKAQPNDPQSEEDRRASREAEKAIFLLRSWWQVKIKNLELAYHAWKSGTTFPYLRYVVDENKYGWSEEPVLDPQPVILEPGGFVCHNCGAKSPELDVAEVPSMDGLTAEPQTVCPQCGKPLAQGAWEDPVESVVHVDNGRKQRYPNGRVELHLLTGLFVTVPFYGTDLESVPFLRFESEPHIGQLIALYPKLREKLEKGEFDSQGGATASAGVIARGSAESQIGLPRNQSRSGRQNFQRLWLRPFMYELVKDETFDTKDPNAPRNLLKTHFPDGIKVARLGKDVIHLDHEKLDDHFGTMQPEVGDYIFRDGICWGLLGHQDAINDVINQLAEIVERINTITFIWAGTVNTEALNDRPNTPMEFMEVAPGTNLDAAMKTGSAPTFPKEATGLITLLDENMQSHSGVLPNIYGGGAPTQTAEQSRNELNQALMQLGTTGEFMIACWIDIFTKGIWELAKNAPKNMKAPMGKSTNVPGAQAESIDFDVLKSGEWHLEGEMGIPRSFAERKDELKSLVQQNPQVASALGVDKPVNAGAVRDYLDLPDLEDPADEERQTVNEIIDELLQGQPIQPPPQPPPPPMPGMPPQPPPPPAPPMPSSTRLQDLLDAGILDPANTAELIKDWAVGPSGRKLYGTPGYANVMAAMKLIQQIMMPPPPLPGEAPQDAGAPGGPPPKPGKPPGPPGPPPPKATPTGAAPPKSGAGGEMAS